MAASRLKVALKVTLKTVSSHYRQHKLKYWQVLIFKTDTLASKMNWYFV